MNSHHHPSTKSFPFLGLAVAAAIATALGLIFISKDEGGKQEIQQDIKKRAENIAKKFKKTRTEVQASIQDTFGEVTEDLEKAYIQVRANILTAIDEAKEGAELTKQGYQNIVKEVVEEFSRDQKWAQKNTDKLIENLKSEWKELHK